MSRPIPYQIDVAPIHDWVGAVHVSWVPGMGSSLTDKVGPELLRAFERLGHVVDPRPNDDTDLLITTAPFGQPIGWREALLFTGRRRLGLKALPTTFTLVHVTPRDLDRVLTHLQRALERQPPDPEQFRFPGMAPQAWKVLVEQGERGGPILSLERVIQAHAKCIRILLLVGDDAPERVYHFDLVGAYPQSIVGDDIDAFYADIVQRMATTVSTYEVNNHSMLDTPLPAATWAASEAPSAMRHAGRELGRRRFFTNMILIADLIQVPAVSEAVASQYSEGCFATWAPDMNGLVVTATGSARPVDKGNITEDDLALVVGVRPDGLGAIAKPVEGRENVPPSSEGFEMIDIDRALPTIVLGEEWPTPGARVPVVRSKLHGHRGLDAYDPRYVEYVSLDAPYFHYPVSCATGAQAQGIRDAFARSVALHDPKDPRQVVFTILPGHGSVVVEKWVPGLAPFQRIWEYMDSGCIQISNRIPQGPLSFRPGPDGRMHLQS
jgi:hypothetical protein